MYLVMEHKRSLMVPKVASYNVFPSSLLLIVAVGDARDAKMIACAAHSSQQIRAMLASFNIVDETDRPFSELISDMARVGFPEESAKATILIGGAAPQSMHGLSDFMDAYAKTGSPPMTPRMNILPRICTFLIAKSSAVPDGMIGYADATRAFHFWIFYSKWEGLRIVRNIGGSATEQRSAEVNIHQCGLRPRGGDSIHLTGEIARYLCLAGELRNHIDRTAS